MITMIHPTHSAVTRAEVVVRAFNSITAEQVGIIAGIAEISGRVWNVQAIDDYDGYRSILIEALIKGDEQKAFFVAGTVQQLELFQVQNDVMALIGTFSDMQTLQARLTGLVYPQ